MPPGEFDPDWGLHPWTPLTDEKIAELEARSARRLNKISVDIDFDDPEIVDIEDGRYGLTPEAWAELSAWLQTCPVGEVNEACLRRIVLHNDAAKEVGNGAR